MKKMSKMSGFRTASVISIATATLLTANPAIAQDDGSAAANEADFGEIVVTARKRAEDMLKTPVAISAVGSEQLGKQGIASVADLSNTTPSMNLNNNNSGRNDRSFQSIIIRGFVPSNAQNPTTSTFIDGVPVSSPTAFNAISDPERVEVLRGPQSAYFGRNTFAGAMNVVSKAPGDEFAGSLTAMAGTRNSYRLQAAIEAPIIGDALGIRLAAGQHGKDGSYRNAYSGETLGDQMTRYASALIVAKPVDGLTVKALGLMSQDRDGAPANGLISARDVLDKNGNVVVKGLSNCTFNVPTSLSSDPTLLPTAVNDIINVPSICGTVKQLSIAPSANTDLDPATANFLANPQGRLMPSLQDFGLKRNYHHLHLNINYDIGDSGFSVSSLTGMNREKYGQYSDIDNYGSVLVPGSSGGRSFYDYAFVVERTTADFSQELRLAYDNGGPIQGTVGLSYLNNWTQGSNGSLSSRTGVSAIAGLTRARTKGGFFGLSYKPTSQFTINAEGRYQSDTLYAYAKPGGQSFNNSAIVPEGNYAEGDTLLKRTYNSFLPRVIAQYDFGREAMIYASWAKGVNPGQFNTGFLTRSQAAIEDAAARGFRIEVLPEKVTNYEIGIKGRVIDGRLNYALSAYYAQWRDQANLLSYNYVHEDIGPNTPLPEQINAQLNSGAVDMKGVELDLGFRVSDLITLGAAGSFNDSYIKALKSTTVTSLTGITDFTGKEMPFTSKWSANANIEFHGDVVGLDDSSWFARADYMFKTGVWSNQANIVKTPNIHKVNVRAGITSGAISLEAFVTNLFNNKAFTSIGDNWIYTQGVPYGNTFSAVVVGLPEVRTGGLQIKYNF